MEGEEYGDEIRSSMKVVTPLDLVMLPNFSVGDAQSVMDLLVGKHGYNPMQKTRFVDGT